MQGGARQLKECRRQTCRLSAAVSRQPPQRVSVQLAFRLHEQLQQHAQPHGQPLAWKASENRKGLMLLDAQACLVASAL
jgi:hypothetical protein